MRNLQQNSFRKFHLERNCTILKMAKINPKQPKFAQNKGTRGPNLTNNPSNSISKLSLIQWNNSFLNLNTPKNRVCKGPPSLTLPLAFLLTMHFCTGYSLNDSDFRNLHRIALPTRYNKFGSLRFAFVVIHSPSDGWSINLHICALMEFMKL